MYAKASEPLVDADLTRYQLALADDPDHGDGFDQLLDLTDVVGLSVTAEGVSEAARVAETFEAQVLGTRCAVVVSSTVAYGMGRMFQAMAPGAVEVGIFRRLSDAREWLDRTSEAQQSRDVDAG